MRLAGEALICLQGSFENVPSDQGLLHASFLKDVAHRWEINCGGTVF